MIISAEIIKQPYSGEFEERIYDNQSSWNSQDWTFIKFTNDDSSEWCGHFRGAQRNVAISIPTKIILVLTSDYLFSLDSETGNMIEHQDQPQYQNLTVAPTGEFLLADFYDIIRLVKSLTDKVHIDSPIKMDSIYFENWEENKLVFTCDEFLNWDNHLCMELDCTDWKIKIRSKTKNGNYPE